jgi:ribosomal protein S18 acetylase RimI-like enzyme
MTAITLRPATSADKQFCFRLHKAAMGDYVTGIWGWDERVQRDFHARAFDPRRWQIIRANGTDVGMLDVERRPDEVYLARIEILPGYQGRGIGTRLIKMLIDEARHSDKAFALDVLANNHRAQALYERLGLAEVGRRGERDQKVEMRLQPASAASGTRRG